MHPFKIGDKVLCISSDGMDQLKVGETYTVNFVDWDNEVGVEEVIAFVHFTKRFKLIEEMN